MLKRGVRILGVDDAAFKRGRGARREVLVVGVVWRTGVLEGVLSTRIERDGDDSTSKILRMVLHSRFASQIKAIMLHGIMFGGFNVVDIAKLGQKLKIPIIAVVRRKPNMQEVFAALRKVKNFEAKSKRIEMAGPIVPLNGFYAQLAWIDVENAKRILQQTGIAPIRTAHLIASGIARGESSGRI